MSFFQDLDLWNNCVSKDYKHTFFKTRTDLPEYDLIKSNLFQLRKYR